MGLRNYEKKLRDEVNYHKFIQYVPRFPTQDFNLQTEFPTRAIDAVVNYWSVINEAIFYRERAVSYFATSSMSKCYISDTS